MDHRAPIEEFLQDPHAASLSDLAGELEDWPAAAKLQKLAARALYLEDERLQRLLDEAVQEAQRLLEKT